MAQRPKLAQLLSLGIGVELSVISEYPPVVKLRGWQRQATYLAGKRWSLVRDGAPSASFQPPFQPLSALSPPSGLMLSA